MKIISYDQNYEIDVVKLWNKCLYSDTISKHIFRKQVLFDDNFNSELALIALEENQVIGFALSTKRQIPYLDRGLEPDRGWINLFFVKEEFQRQGIGTKLVFEIEKRLTNADVKNITLASYSPNYFFPGIDKNAYPNAISFFMKYGYKCTGDAVSMQRDLWNYNMSKSSLGKKANAEKEGFNFKKFTYNYSLKLLEFLKITFGGGWKRNALMAMQNNEAEETIWIVTDKEDAVVGFCMRKMDGNDDRFGPFGVKEELRSHGLGGILFELMMEDMRSNKYYYLYFLWTHGDGMRFYEKHGVNVYRRYYLYSKTI